MNPLPSELAGTRIISPVSNCCQNGSCPNGATRWLITFVVETFTTASFVLRTTSTVTVLRRLMESCARKTDGIESNDNRATTHRMMDSLLNPLRIENAERKEAKRQKRENRILFFCIFASLRSAFST